MAKRRAPQPAGDGMFATPAAAAPKEPATKVPGFDYIQAIRDGDLATLFWRQTHGYEGRWSMERDDQEHVGELTDDQLRALACGRLAIPDVYATAIVVTTTQATQAAGSPPARKGPNHVEEVRP